MSFKDKVVLVTGASSGIGAAIAIAFAREGAKVAIVGRNKEKLKAVAAQCGTPLVITAEVDRDEDCRKMIHGTVSHFGKLDVLVNNAGIFDLVNIADQHALQVFDKVMNTNLRPAVYLTNLAAPQLIKTKGNIVNISSIAALSVKAGRGSFAYGASKAAMDHFGRCAALDLSSSGVRVNTINPGPVETSIIENAGMVAPNDKSLWENVKQLTALKRVSDPKEVADLTLYLASDKAVGITGAAITVDNGQLLEDGMFKI